jgi:TRAP-type mannitol/chloroaromatic compound transport system permease small subunit
MQALLKLSGLIDRMNTLIGRSAVWLVLAAVLISSVNAVVRKAFNMSSNAFLEMQWYLFAAVFLLCAPYALLKNEHVRIDVISGRFSQRSRVWMELAGTLLFLLPIVSIVLYFSWPVFLTALHSGEVSPNDGGLALWPARLLVPVGFLLLILQAFSQAFKCVGFLGGACADPLQKERKLTAEEELAEAIRRSRAAKGGGG